MQENKEAFSTFEAVLSPLQVRLQSLSLDRAEGCSPYCKAEAVCNAKVLVLLACLKPSRLRPSRLRLLTPFS